MPAAPSRVASSPGRTSCTPGSPRGDCCPLEAASHDLGKHLRAPQRGTPRAYASPSRSSYPALPSSRFVEGAVGSRSRNAHQPRRSSGSTGTAPTSAKTTGERLPAASSRWRCLRTPFHSNRRAVILSRNDAFQQQDPITLAGDPRPVSFLPFATLRRDSHSEDRPHEPPALATRRGLSRLPSPSGTSKQPGRLENGRFGLSRMRRNETTPLACNPTHPHDLPSPTIFRNVQPRAEPPTLVRAEGVPNALLPTSRQSGERRRRWLGTTPWNHARRRMTIASNLGTTSAHRPDAQDSPLESEGRVALVARLCHVAAVVHPLRVALVAASPLPAKDSLRSAQRLALSCVAPKERSD
jgi:hypothetical protein